MADLTAEAKVDAFIRDNLRGQCKMLSLGNACPCALCAFDVIRSRLATAEGDVLRLRKIAAHVPAMVYIKAKEGAGYGAEVKAVAASKQGAE